MFYHSLFSGVLLVLPIAVTIGLYVGIEQHRLANDPNGSGGLFGGGGGILGTGRLVWTTDRYCQKGYGITPAPGRYTFNPNQWGDPDNTGKLCMNITTNNKPSSNDQFAANFTATWQYPQAAGDQPVHAYPNVKLELNKTMPARLASVNQLPVDIAWSYAVGNHAKSRTNHDELSVEGLNANVAIDMFLAADEAESSSTTKSDFEIMVWLGRWGNSTDPIGFSDPVLASHVVNTTTFSLYSGTNTNTNQTVFTWLARENTTGLVGDIFPLIEKSVGMSGLTSSVYLGYIALGSEALYSPNNVTFSVQTLAIDIVSK